MSQAQMPMHEAVGWRAVIGTLSPTFGGLSGGGGGGYAEAAPKGVVFHRANFHGPLGWSVEAIQAVLPQVPEVAKEAAFPGVDLILQGGLPIGIINGIGTDKRIIQDIEEATQVQATTTATSVVEALRRLQITKIIIVTSYFGEQVNEIFDKFMQDSGFEVVHHAERGQVRWSEVPPHAYYRISKNAYRNFPQAQGILIAPGRASCSSEVVEALETDLGIPAVTQHAAVLWNILNLVEIRGPIEGRGQLLKLL